MKDLAVITAVVLTFVGYIPYLRDTFAGRTTPHIYTWFIWGLVTAIAFVLQVADGAGWPSAVTLSASVVCFAIFLISLGRGNTEVTSSDKVCLALALLAVIAWLGVDNPRLAVILVATADVLGFVPTIRKSWSKPHEETLSSYLMNTVRFSLAIYALERVTLVTSLYSVTWVLANGLFSVLLIVRRVQRPESDPKC